MRESGVSIEIISLHCFDSSNSEFLRSTGTPIADSSSARLVATSAKTSLMTSRRVEVGTLRVQIDQDSCCVLRITLLRLANERFLACSKNAGVLSASCSRETSNVAEAFVTAPAISARSFYRRCDFLLLLSSRSLNFALRLVP